MTPAPFRAQLSAALGFPATFTPTDEQIIDAAKATAKRADDAEMELARVHGALDEAGVKGVSGSVELDAVDRVLLLVAERDTLRNNPTDLELHALRGALGLDARMPDAEVVKAAVGRLNAPPQPATGTWEGLQKIHGDYYTLSRLAVPGGWLYKTTTWSEYREHSRMILAQQVTFVPAGVSNG